MKKKLPFLISLFALLLTSLGFNWHLLRKVEQVEGSYKVAEIVDGDTFILETDQSIRLADLDAPELNFCLGKEAKERLEKLILGKRVKLETTGRGSFKRTIALVYQNNIFVNKVMLEEGWGRYDCTGTDKDEELKAASHQAQDAKKGVYGSQCTPVDPPNPQCVIKGNIDKHYRKKIYHFPGCGGYNVVIIEKDRGEDWFCSEKEAQEAGFVKSKQCYGKKYKGVL